MRTRLLSALVLVPLVLVLVFFAPPELGAGLLLLPVFVAAGEWAGLCGLTRGGKGVAVVLFAAVLVLSWASLDPRAGSLGMGAAGLFAVGILGLLLLHRGSVRARAWLELAAGFTALAALWWTAWALLEEHTPGREALLSLLVLVWVADTAAYLVGSLWGRRPLAPRVSPRKTWEGAFGGLVATLLAGFILRLGGALGPIGLLFALLGAAAVWAAALLGDLAESRLKRLRGVKDSGTLIPGHGGLLDRIDGLMVAAPVFYCFWCLRGGGGW